MKDQALKIGWASTSITPDRPTMIGGQFYVRVSEYVNDPVTATALALESADGSNQAILVSLDLNKVMETVRTAARQRLAAAIPGLAADALCINATHTHSSCVTVPHPYPVPGGKVIPPEEYTEFLAERICEVACQAWENRRPGAVAWGRGQAVVGANRRMCTFDSSSKMYGKTDIPEFSHIEGYEDHGVDLLFTCDTAGALTGMIVNLACPAQVTEHSRFVSADFWHEARQDIRARLGSNLFILPQCSAAGDQSPHLLLNQKSETRMLRLKGFVEHDDLLMAERREIGRRIGATVEETLPAALRDLRKEVVFKHICRTINLPERKVTEAEGQMAIEKLVYHEEGVTECVQDPLDRKFSSETVQIWRFKKVLERFKTQGSAPVLPMEAHFLRIGDIAMATSRFELFLDYGIRIKARAPSIQTFVVQLAGEGTYLPTEKAISGKSYGAGVESCLCGPEGGQVLVEKSLDVLHELFA